MKNRLKSLENRLFVLCTKHYELHASLFEKGGNYKEVTKEYPILSESPIGKEMEHYSGLIDTLRTEILAINYYEAIINTENIFSLIDRTTNVINKYEYLGQSTGKIKTENLFPIKK